ncbi:MAG: hypothetical protein F2749_02560, partial [Actinobacteria bacterium]|nr:hypothetical protein [Actinomycetota bacterium]
MHRVRLARQRRINHRCSRKCAASGLPTRMDATSSACGTDIPGAPASPTTGLSATTPSRVAPMSSTSTPRSGATPHRFTACCAAALLMLAACSDRSGGTSNNTVGTSASTLSSTSVLTPTTAPFTANGPMCPPVPGGRVAYQRGEPNGSAYTWSVRVTSPSSGADNELLAGDAGVQLGEPSWSPDGTRVVVSAGDGTNSKFVVLRCDGSLDHELPQLQVQTPTTPLAIDRPTLPTWSPDGRLLAFVSSDGLFFVPPDGSAAPQITASDLTIAIGRATWSPDSQRVVVGATAADGNTDLYLVDPATGTFTRLTTDPAEDYQPAWCSDGSLIAFRSGRDGQIWVMNGDGTDQHSLSTGEGAESAFQPVWSSDCTRIAYVVGEQGNTRLHVMNADGSADH